MRNRPRAHMRRVFKRRRHHLHSIQSATVTHKRPKNRPHHQESKFSLEVFTQLGGHVWRGERIRFMQCKYVYTHMEREGLKERERREKEREKEIEREGEIGERGEGF